MSIEVVYLRGWQVYAPYKSPMPWPTFDSTTDAAAEVKRLLDDGCTSVNVYRVDTPRDAAS